MKDQYPVYITSISSFLAGGISRSLVYPIDTVKAKLQVQQVKLHPQFTSISGAFRVTFAEEGLRGLYRGMSMSILASFPANCIYYSTYEAAKQFLIQSAWPQFAVYFAAGMFAETISCVIFVPIDVIKERLQVQSNIKEYSYKNSTDALVTILNTEGVRGIYKAYGATLASFGPFSAIYFTIYEALKENSVGKKKEIGLVNSICCSAAAGAFASFVTSPLDMVKVRMQVMRATSLSKTRIFQYKNVFQGTWHIYKTEGAKALFQGSFSRILFHTPNTAISMGLVEHIRNFLQYYSE